MSRLDRDVLLCLEGTRSEVRRQHDVRSFDQRVVCCRRFRREHVDAGPGDRPGLQSFGECRFVDDAAASHVQDARALLHHAEFASTEQALRLGTQRHVNREEIDAGKQFIQVRGSLEAEFRRLGRRHEWIESHDGHVEAFGPACDFATDASQAHDAERFPGQLGADELVAIPAAGLHHGVGRGNFTGQGEHEGHGVFRRRDGVPARRVHHHDALAGGGGHVDVIDADAGASDGSELARRFEYG